MPMDGWYAAGAGRMERRCPWTGGMPRVQDAWSGDAQGGEVKYVVCAGQALIAAP